MDPPRPARGGAAAGIWLGARPAAAIAGAAVRALGWELPAEAMRAARIPGPKLVLYHRADNVVHYEAASLHLALKDAGDVGDVQEVEVRRLGHRGRGRTTSDLVADEVTWKALSARGCARRSASPTVR